MKRWLKRLIKLVKNYVDPSNSLINIYISKSALIHNLNSFKSLKTDRLVAPVLKSNAYGHGLIPIAEILEKENPPFFVIDSYFEVKSLRNDGIRTKLLMIGYSPVETIIKNKLKNISFTITGIATLADLAQKIKKFTNIHLKIDTGMNRQGILADEIEEAIKIIKSNNKINLEGICSHFSDADNTDASFTEKQIQKWNEIVKTFKNEFPNLKYWHISNTDGHFHDGIDANLTRLGIGLYGIQGNLDLKPVLKMETIISGIKKINKGEVVGYGNTFTAEKDMVIATIPAGYYEGIDRRLSNNGFVKIGNTYCPIVGRVSMNITTIDVSNIVQLELGDKVIVISDIRNDKNSIENIAKSHETIPYEITVHIPQHLKRVVIK